MIHAITVDRYQPDCQTQLLDGGIKVDVGDSVASLVDERDSALDARLGRNGALCWEGELGGV